MRNSLRMQRQRTDFDALARLVIAFNVIQHFITIKIRMVVRHDHRKRMKVERARAKRADHEVVRFKSLVRWRRHVMLANDRTEVIDVEAVGVIATIPTHDIKRVIVVVVRVHLLAALDAHFELALFVDGHRHFGQSQIAFAIRRVLKKLRGLLRHVARWRQNVRTVYAFNQQETRLVLAIFRRIKHHAINRALGNHDVILGTKLERAKHREDRAASEVHEEALIA